MITEFGQRVRELRRNAQLSQEQLAEKFGVTVQAVSKWECSQSYPDIELMRDIAGTFGVTVDYLLNGEKSFDFVPAADFPDDDMIRIVQYRGNKLLRSDIYDPNVIIPIEFSDDKKGISIEIWGSADINGGVNGNVSAGAGITCDGVIGNVIAGTEVTCDGVVGNVNAGGQVSCDDVNGNVNAGFRVECGDVEGDVNAGNEVCCGDIGRNVSAGGTVNCGDIEGSAEAHGDINSGDIGGDAKAGRDISCGDVEGNIYAKGNVSCGDVDGSVNAEGSVDLDF